MKSGTIEIAAALVVLFTAIINPMAALVLAVVALAALGAYRWRNEKDGGNGGESARSKTLNDARADEKQRAVEKVFAEIQRKGTIRNDEVQALLGVSDATAERYLQALETEGRIAQVGGAGKTVSYKVA